MPLHAAFRQVPLALLLGAGLVGQVPVLAATPRLDGLLAVNDAPSPCGSVQVRVDEDSRLKGVVSVVPDGRVTPAGSQGKPPVFQKGRAYSLQATCVSTSQVFQNSTLTFQADGRTVMLVFTKSGFQFKRGGLAY